MVLNARDWLIGARTHRCFSTPSSVVSIRAPLFIERRSIQPPGSHALPASLLLCVGCLSIGSLMFQTICQRGITLSIHDALDCLSNGFVCSDQHIQLLGTRQASIQKISP